MKKYLFLSLLAAGLPVLIQAQRLVLYEEFTSENSAPSAAANPGLEALINANASKIILLKYQSPLPSAGPLYNQDPADVQARVGYYGVTFTPYGRMDGKVLGAGSGAGNVTNLTQTAIDNEAALPSAFAITATHSWSAAGDSIYATINVQATAAFAPAGAQMRLRTALVEQLSFDLSPGSNHETDFRNVVRKMYPDASGQSALNSWTASQSQTFTVSGLVPSYINKAKGVFLIVWLQNDADKVVAQAGVSAPVAIPLDAGSDSTRFPVSLLCTNAATNVSGNVTLKNAGTSALTASRIFYKLDNNAWQSYSWTGTIAPGGTTNVILPPVSATPGTHILTDSVTLPNNATDINAGNSKSAAEVWIHNIVAVNIPQGTGFENSGALPANWMLYDADADTRNWQLVKGQTPLGHAGSTYTLIHNNFNFPVGEANYVLFPQMNLVAGPKTLDFWVAYAQFVNEEDLLEIVFSNNCGQTWDPLWGQAGANLATAPPTTAAYVPAQSQWKQNSVDISGVPVNALLAFRATSRYGNNLYLDDISVHSGNSTGVGNMTTDNGPVLYPNPARDAAHLSFVLNETGRVRVEVNDATGRTISVAADELMKQGLQHLTIATDNLAPGLYTVRIINGSAGSTMRLAVIK